MDRTMALKTGKLPPEMLRKLLRHRGASDGRVVLGPSVGEDAAVVRLGKELLVLKTDPVTYASDMIGWYAVNVNANDIATRGAKPVWFQAVILLPPGTDEQLVELIFKQISRAAGALGIAVTGGHTEVTPGIERPIVVGDMHGLLGGRRPVTTSGARVGDMLVMTKSAGVEGTAAIARERRNELVKTLGRSVVDRASRYLFRPGISIVPEAAEALKFGVSSMHDPTEGGIRMGVFEMAAASGRSFEFYPDKVPVSKETAMICEKYDLDPLGLLGSGSLLATFPHAKAEAYVKKVKKMGMRAAIVGRVVPGRGRSASIVDGSFTPLSSSERDEILKVLGP